jgi:hypothetical protein
MEKGSVWMGVKYTPRLVTGGPRDTGPLLDPDEALAISTAKPVIRSTSDGETMLVEAKPHEPLTNTRTPIPKEPSLLRVSTTPERTTNRSWLVSTSLTSQ